MTGLELIILLQNRVRCEIDVQRPDADQLNLNEHGQVNRLSPITPGRPKFTVTLDQDAVDDLAALIELRSSN